MRNLNLRASSFLALAFLMSACATRYKVATYPAGAKIRVENVITKESFDIGEGPINFDFDERYGEGFVLVAEKEAFYPKKIFVTRAAGSETTYQINLEPKKPGGTGADGSSNDKDDKKDDKKDAADKKENDQQLAKRLEVLERVFEIYKDALFSQRYGTGPASYDRDRIDTQVSLVTKAQQLIEKHDLNGAMDVVDKIIGRDEYMAQGHVLKGTVHYLRSEMPQAIAQWERALEINPYDRLTREYLISAYRKAGKALPPNVDEIQVVDRSPASSPLEPDPLHLRLRSK